MEMSELYLFDKNKELIDIIPPNEEISSDQDWILNSLINHSASGVYRDSINEAQFFGVKDVDDDSIFWQYKITHRKVENNVFEFKGIYVLFDDLQGRGVIRDRRPQNAPIRTVLDYILEDTGWKIGQVLSNHTGTSNYYYTSKLDAFWDFLGKWRVEYRPRMTYSNGEVTGRYIDIYDRVSDDFGKWYEYGDKLVTVVAEETSESVYTAFIGRGKGEEVGEGFGRRIDFENVNWSIENGNPAYKPVGDDYLEIPEATALYGYEDGTPRMTVVEFPDIEDEEELLQATYNYAMSEARPKTQFKSVVNELEKAEVGEIVTMIRDDLNIRYKTRIFRLTRNFLNSKLKQIEFGEQLAQSVAQRTKQIKVDTKKSEEQTLNWLLALRKAVTDSYFNNDGYNYDLHAGNEYNLPGGYYSFDRPIDQNPTKVVYVGAGSVLIANSQNPDGSWIWRTAITGDGIVADEINTGTLRADLIQAGFNDIAYGIIMTSTSLNVVSSLGHYMEFIAGSIRTYDKFDSLVGSYGLATDALDETITGTANFIQPGHAYSLVRNNPGDTVNEVIIYVPSDVDELRMGKTLNVNRHEVNNVHSLNTVLTSNGVTYEGSLLTLSTGELYLGGRKGLKLGFRRDNLSYALLNIPEVGDISTARGLLVGGNLTTYGMKLMGTLDADGSEITNISNLYQKNGSGTSIEFVTPTGLKLIGGNNGTGIGYKDTNNEITETFRTYQVGANVSYRDINMGGNSITNQSDIRLKKDITPTELNALKEIDKMTFVNFEWDKSLKINEKKPDGVQFGQVAQYAPKMMQKQVDGDNNYLSVDSSIQLNLASKAIQELNKKVNEQADELSELKALLREKGVI